MPSGKRRSRLWTVISTVLLAYGYVGVAAAQPGTATILVGNVNSNPFISVPMNTAAARYGSNAARAGYTVVSNPSANINQMVAAITAQPEVLVICAHGSGATDSNGTPLAGVDAADGALLTPGSFPVGASFPGVKEVVFQSCSQLDPARLAQWRTVFPNANIHGYERCVNPWKALLDALSYVFHPPSVPPAAGAVPFPVAPTPPPTPMTVVINGHTISNYPTPLNPAFLAPSALAAAVGQQTIDLYAIETASGDTVFILGLLIDNGRVAEFRNDVAYNQPTVVMRMVDSVFQQVSAAPEELLSEYSNGHVEVQRFGTDVSAQLLVQTVAILALGSPEEVPAVSNVGAALMVFLVLAAATYMLVKLKMKCQGA